jgi:hypothetical protein
LASGKQKDETKGISKKRKNRKVRFQGRPTRYLNGLVEKKSAKMYGPDDVTMLLQ